MAVCRRRSVRLHLTDTAIRHYSRAIKLAGDAGDVLAMVSAVQHQAVGWRELGAPNDALKLDQLALMQLDQMPDGPGKAERQAWLHVHAARAFADLGYPDHARDQQRRASQLSTMKLAFDQAYMNDNNAAIELAIGRLDTAEQYAAKSMRTWGPEDLRDSAPVRIRPATIHAMAGESDTPQLTEAALDAVEELRSVRSRAMLVPLEDTLRAREDSTWTDLGERVRQVRQGLAGSA
jgi:tetratricopeptide (TPR) repeat protein